MAGVRNTKKAELALGLRIRIRKRGIESLRIGTSPNFRSRRDGSPAELHSCLGTGARNFRHVFVLMEAAFDKHQQVSASNVVEVRVRGPAGGCRGKAVSPTPSQC